MCKFVAYYRVSTKKQGDSGLGLEAQVRAVKDFAAARGCRIIEEFEEIESGRKNDRPKLQAAIRHAKATGATLLIAKMDRLCRSVPFLYILRDQRVGFIAADMPDANEFTINVMVTVAEHEAKATSARTKAALAAAKARKVQLGNPQGFKNEAVQGMGYAASLAARQAKADDKAKSLESFVAEIKASGVNTLQGIADALNAKEMFSPRGKAWEAKGISRLLARLA